MQVNSADLAMRHERDLPFGTRERKGEYVESIIEGQYGPR